MNHVQIKWNAVAVALFIIVVISVIVYYLYLGMPLMFYIIQFRPYHVSFGLS